MTNTYKCYMCKGEFKKGWSDEEAKAEAAEAFPGYEIQDDDLVCNDCYKKAMSE